MFKAIFPRYSVGDRRLLESVRHSAQQGFTMFEVLIALMISFLFLTGTLNAMVMATVMRVKAEREAQAGYWIKEDLEQVRALAANFNPATGNGCPTSVGETFRDANNSADADPNNDGLASLPVPANKSIVGVTAAITRTPGVSNNVLTLSYRVRNTNVTDNDMATLATLYTEVLPAAALACE
ncbi:MULTISPECIES: type II secretion system protein J [unclassified Synechocystis]|jgi:prepilin-type N-terminal cleavage/methylation domain-containing protein|nr:MULTISPECIES: type II secretion system protein [unclassified Synechocystis]UOO10538.1 type II secretion system GspH family protein [Synechocystis sp. PCC 6803]